MRVRTVLLAGAAGAVVQYFADPDRGRGRRTKAIDRLGGLVRRTRRRGERLQRYAVSELRGFSQRLQHAEVPAPNVPDDVTLVHKVESELFGDHEIPKGRLNVNAEEGLVTIRGSVERPGQISEIERKARRVDGVRGVRNLLHMPGTPAPNKLAARRAGEGTEA